MGVELSITITAPVDDSERDLVSAVSMLLFALGQQGKPEEPAEEEPQPEEPPADEAFAHALPGPRPALCMKPTDDGRVCVSAVAHRGRHLYRFIAPEGMLN